MKQKTITRLSPDQAAKLEQWRDLWLKIGLCTDPADREGARRGVIAAYAAAGLDAPALFVWLRSPLEGALGAAMLHAVLATLAKGIESQVWSQVESQVRSQVESQVWSTTCWGQHDAGWLSFYDYFRVVVTFECAERLAGLIRVAECCGWWWPYRGGAVLTERPIRLRRDVDGRLHCTDGVAIEYPDGWGVWALHGVRVPRELVLTPADQLDPRLMLKESNAEVRREFVRKIGIERVCSALGATVLDKRGDVYELLSLDLGDGRRRPYLKMRNPSIDVYHIEGVPPDCTTVEKALNWRNQSDATPAILT